MQGENKGNLKKVSYFKKWEGQKKIFKKQVK